MNTRCSMVVLGALALTAQAFGARADGTITSLTLNHPATVTCYPEAITVNATGLAGGPPTCGVVTPGIPIPDRPIPVRSIIIVLVMTP